MIRTTRSEREETSQLQIPFCGFSHPRVEAASLLHQVAPEEGQPAHVVVAEAHFGRPCGLEDRLTARLSVGGQVILITVDQGWPVIGVIVHDPRELIEGIRRERVASPHHPRVSAPASHQKPVEAIPPSRATRRGSDSRAGKSAAAGYALSA